MWEPAAGPLLSSLVPEAVFFGVPPASPGDPPLILAMLLAGLIALYVLSPPSR